jgi:hypothetical protein
VPDWAFHAERDPVGHAPFFADLAPCGRPGVRLAEQAQPAPSTAPRPLRAHCTRAKACGPGQPLPLAGWGPWADAARAKAHAAGVPSALRELASLLLDSQHVQLSWALPADTGQGNGAPSQAEPLLRYEVWAVRCNFSESASDCAVAGGGPLLLSATADTLGNATVVAGLTSARRYVLYLRAVNRAGGGGFGNATQVTLDLPSAPQNFTATVSPAYGPLRVALSWAPPANTGQGLGSQSGEPILGFRLYLGDDAGSLNGSRCRLLFKFQGVDRTFLASFPASRREPYYFMVSAVNLLGYGSNATGAALTSEQAVALPSAPRNLTVVVSGVLRVSLTWRPPADTGVGDSSRQLVS